MTSPAMNTEGCVLETQRLIHDDMWASVMCRILILIFVSPIA